MAANIQDSILLFGDSITQSGWCEGGFAQLLAAEYNRKLDVINRGLSGYNTEWGLAAFKHIFAPREKQPSLPVVRLLTIWLGANDAALPGDKQHVSFHQYMENIHTMASIVQSPTSPYYSPRTRIVLLTPPPVNPTQFLQGLNRTPEHTKRYVDGVKLVGEELNLPVVDVWSLFWEKASEKQEGLVPFLSDGLHLTKDGYKMVFDALMETIKTSYPELTPEKLPHVFPCWDQLDPDNIGPCARTYQTQCISRNPPN
ncbi:SGNH hydrolase-type esterase domain-containing protein [Cantharellus anzutake]|uniref:SGNH hydrolase-type esterase domain-containing protein n=1 Tax=Cantharellus anzutake TaxID=1750568 RepID=UPI001904A1D4|nr:SGNH hydrolase-type esterase domain-containing protein [Cantharellus anzutake]KAF8325441.1 SGNH hydrolase-type esterase domain-containing protein [Cantharellus anzutake]